MTGREQDVVILIDGQRHAGWLAQPPAARGLVLFAHGSGSSRLSPRNRFVARHLQVCGLATLLFDLLTEAEDRVYENRFDIDLLADRLRAATDWARRQPELIGLPLGYFGASTGAAAALMAAAEETAVRAIVSRGGRPDLAMAVLPRVRAATLLIVGERDETVLALNRAAYARLVAPKSLEIVPGATHLFEEPGALERVAELAAAWFVRHLDMSAKSSPHEPSA
jgi:dienelactone hydrolase